LGGGGALFRSSLWSIGIWVPPLPKMIVMKKKDIEVFVSTSRNPVKLANWD